MRGTCVRRLGGNCDRTSFFRRRTIMQDVSTWYSSSVSLAPVHPHIMHWICRRKAYGKEFSCNRTKSMHSRNKLGCVLPSRPHIMSVGISQNRHLAPSLYMA